MSMVDLAELLEFILARVAEDEALGGVWSEMSVSGEDRAVGASERADVQRCWDDYERRIKAECEAKRELVKLAHESFLSMLCQDDCGWNTLRVLATLYADHPDFREEWRR